MLSREELYQGPLFEVSSASLTDAREKALIDLMRHFALFIVAFNSCNEMPGWAITEAQLTEHKDNLVKNMTKTLHLSRKDFGMDMKSSSPTNMEVSSRTFA